MIRTAAAIAVCASLVVPAHAFVQDDDDKAVGSYTLTVANVRKVKAALDELDKRKVEPPSKVDDESLDAAIRRIEKDPNFPVLRAAGLTAKDFLMTITALVLTAVHLGVSGDESGKNLPPHLRAHHKFMVEHEADVKPLLETLLGGK